MRGNGARHRWLLSRFGNCPRDRRSITIIYNYSTNYASQARLPPIPRSVTIPLHAYDRSSNSVYFRPVKLGNVIFAFRISRVLRKTFWNFASIVMKGDFRDYVGPDRQVFQHRSNIVQLKYERLIYLGNSFISGSEFQVIERVTVAPILFRY